MKKKYVVCLLAFSLTFTCISPTGTIVYASEMGSSSQQEEEKSVETNETAGQNGDFTEALDGLEQQESALEETTEQLNLLNVSSWNLGNGSAYILNDGTIAMEGDSAIAFDEEDGCLTQTDADGNVTVLAQVNGRNLNVFDDYIYYTDGEALVRLSRADGSVETIFTAENTIHQLYVVNEKAVYFLMDGSVWAFSLGEEANGAPVLVKEDGAITGFIPTEYGMIYAKGDLFDRTVYAGEMEVKSGVWSFYTENGDLYISTADEDERMSVSELFGVYSAEAVSTYSIGEEVTADEIFHEAEDCVVCDENAELVASGAETFVADEEPLEVTAISAYANVSNGQKNIVKRARQMHEVEWTPLQDIVSWKRDDGYVITFRKGVTYNGLPYGQPVYAKYVPWNATLKEFVAAVKNEDSKMYTSRSTYNRSAPYYSSDCSAFVSWAWGLSSRQTTSSIPYFATKVTPQNLYGLQVGDALDKSGSHVVLVEDIGYDDDGDIVYIDIMEQTPPKTKETRYGIGGEKSLSDLYTRYIENGGYVIYRSKTRDSVKYTHDCTVPIDGDYCSSSCRNRVSFENKDVYLYAGKSMTLSLTNNTGTSVTSWSTKNPSVATITSGGVVTGVSAGTAQIVVKAGSYTSTCTVHVITEQEVVDRAAVKEFVTRLYKNILGRDPDTNGLNAWVEELATGKQTGSGTVAGFFFSKEFLGKDISDDEFVTILYRTIFDREPDPSGKNAWLRVLAKGQSRNHVISGFTGSTEFKDMCADYGILTGSYKSTEIVDKKPDVTAFVVRMYETCLDRKPDKNGLYAWVEELLNGDSNGLDIAKGFLLSQEMDRKDLSDSDFLDICYRALFDRKADAAGKQDWQDQIDDGASRKRVVVGFVYSQEYMKLCRNYGIQLD